MPVQHLEASAIPEARTMSATTGNTKVERLAKRRLRRSSTLTAPLSGEAPYAIRRAELKGISPGKLTQMIIATTAWELTVGARLTLVDEHRFSPHKPGPTPLYTSEEFESMLLYRALSGFETTQEARNVLSSDKRANMPQRPRVHLSRTTAPGRPSRGPTASCRKRPSRGTCSGSPRTNASSSTA